MDKKITPDLRSYAYCYLDDVIVVTPTFELHLKVLEEVLRRMREFGFTLNFEKSHFCQIQAKFLGFQLDRDRLRPDPDKIAPIFNYPMPKNVRQVRRLNGMVNWYHRHLKDIASSAAPLNRLTRKDVTWQWIDLEEEAFQRMKKALAEVPTLVVPNYDLPFTLYTDASQYGIGAILVQPDDDKERLISCASKSLTSAESNYSTTEKECLAVIWALELSGYNMEISFRRGTENEAPDALSRMFEEAELACQEFGALNDDVGDEWYDEKCRVLEDDPFAIEGYKHEAGDLYRRCRDPLRAVIADDDQQWKLVVHQNDRPIVLQRVHDNPQAGHLGMDKTYDRARSRF